MTPFVTVVIPTFNREATLPATLDALRAQTDPDWECVLVDDGSSDQTLALARKAAQEDARFRVLERPADRPKGANACRNLGAAESQGNHLIFLDSDDVLTPNCIAGRKACVAAHPKADYWVFTSEVRRTDAPAGKTFNRDPKSGATTHYLGLFLTDQVPWLIMSPLWKAQTFAQLGGFDEGLQRHQDADLHVRALLAGLHMHRAPGTADNTWLIGSEHRQRDFEWRRRRLVSTFAYLDKVGEALTQAGQLAPLKTYWKYFWYRVYKDNFAWHPGQLAQERATFDQLVSKYGVFTAAESRKLAAVQRYVQFRARWNKGWLRGREAKIDRHFSNALDALL